MASVSGDLATICWASSVTAASRRSSVTTPVDQSEINRRCGIDRIACEQHFHHLFARHISAYRHHRGRAEQTDVDAGRCEIGRLGGDRKIACRRRAGSLPLSPWRGPLAITGLGNLVRPSIRSLHCWNRASYAWRPGFARISLRSLSGAERRSVAGNHHGPDAIVRSDRVELVLEGRHESHRERVARRAGGSSSVLQRPRHLHEATAHRRRVGLPYTNYRKRGAEHNADPAIAISRNCGNVVPQT